MITEQFIIFAILYGLKTQTSQNILASVADLIDSSLVVIEGEVGAPDDALEMIGKRKKNSKECKNKKDNNNNSFQVNLYIPCVSTDLFKYYIYIVGKLIY